MTPPNAGWRPAWYLALFGGAALWLLIFGNPAETIERRLFDSALRIRGMLGWTPPADSRVVIVGLDDEAAAGMPSLDDEYRAAARLIDEASELGAAAIVFDAIYVRGTPAMAEPILQAITRGTTPVVLAEAMRAPPGDENKTVRLRSFPFAERALPAGLINIAADADGTNRSYSLLHRNGTAFEPSLALSAWSTARGLGWGTDVTQPTAGVIRWPELSADGRRVEEREMRPRPDGTRLLNFRGSWREGAGFGHLTLQTLRELHAKDSPQGSRPLAEKILFFAYVATGVADLGATAFGANEPLVLLHATAVNDLLQDSFFFRAPRWADALGLLSLTAFAAAMSLSQRKAWLVALWLIGLAAILGAALALLLKAHLLVSTSAMMALWSVAVVLELARRHTTAVAQRRRLRDTMAMYFSPRVLKDVLDNPGRLAPKQAEIVVLLTDLRNSTALAEKLRAEGMLDLLNRIFTVENGAVFAEEGSMEKPVGDQFLAYWGAPDPQPDGADRALRAALALISGLQDLRETFDQETRELFGYGVALHAGPSLIGNIGSSQFFHYGPVGDLMNATARVESLTKYYGVLILATREFFTRLKQPAEARVIDRVLVKGKSAPLELIEVRNPASGEDFPEIAKGYSEAFALYQEGKFSEAERMFRNYSASDKSSRVLADRCAQFSAKPPEDWRGVYKMEAK